MKKNRVCKKCGFLMYWRPLDKWWDCEMCDNVIISDEGSRKTTLEDLNRVRKNSGLKSVKKLPPKRQVGKFNRDKEMEKSLNVL